MFMSSLIRWRPILERQVCRQTRHLNSVEIGAVLAVRCLSFLADRSLRVFLSPLFTVRSTCVNGMSPARSVPGLLLPVLGVNGTLLQVVF